MQACSQALQDPFANLTAYYNEDGFLLLSPSYVIDSTRHPYRRFTYSLYVGCNGDFQIELDDDGLISVGAVLLSPGVLRKKVIAPAGGILIVDFAVHTQQAMQLRLALGGRRLRLLDRITFQPVVEHIEACISDANTKAEIDSWRAALLDAFCPQCAAPMMDARVTRAMQLIRTLPREEIALERLAAAARLSPSYLRHMFVEESGMTIRQYARTQMLWRGVLLWAPGVELTGLAHEAGACDLAHFGRAHHEAFGGAPRALAAASKSRRLMRY